MVKAPCALLYDGRVLFLHSRSVYPLPKMYGLRKADNECGLNG